MKEGLFITFEGPDGSGKTTLSQRVTQELLDRNYPVILTREPGGSKIAEEIRDIILNVDNQDMDAKTEALLYAASRRQHLIDIIYPALREGKIVLSDRFVDSSLAYQGFGREIGIEEVFELNQFAIENRMPDITLFLDLDYQTGLKRIASRPHKDRLDQESQAFHKKVQEGYEVVKQRYQDRMVIIDASQPIEVLVQDITKYLIEQIKRHEQG